MREGAVIFPTFPPADGVVQAWLSDTRRWDDYAESGVKCLGMGEAVHWGYA